MKNIYKLQCILLVYLEKTLIQETFQIHYYTIIIIFALKADINLYII